LPAACACRGSEKKEPTREVASAAIAPPPAPSAAAPVPADAPNPFRKPVPIPSGPRFPIEPGLGIGPIRFGATVATIERLMGVPCEIRTEDACRYLARGVEFFLKDGVAAEIHVHRTGRPTTPKPATFGIFNGLMREGVAAGMLKNAVPELIGPPLKVEPVTDPGDAHTIEVDHYRGMRIEYDQLDNGTVVVGGIVIVPDAAGKKKP
jgi:hypothetical protein